MGLFSPNVEKLKRAKNVPGLIEALQDKNQFVRQSASRALGELGDVINDAGAADALIVALEDDYEVVVGNAADALGELGYAPAVDPLIGVLRHEDSYCRWRAIRALGQLGDPRAVGGLLFLLLTFRDRGERKEAAEALVRIAQPEAREAAKDFLGGPAIVGRGERRPPSPVVSLAVARWLSAAGGDCDICKERNIESAEMHRVPAPQFRQVVEAGYNPFASGRADPDVYRKLGFDAEEMYEGWRSLALRDTSDWGLCRLCAEDVADFIIWSPGPPRASS
jgi:HEAT repeat protein